MHTPTLIRKSTDQSVAPRSHGVCWRPECRRAYGLYSTVSYRRGNVIVAHCHECEYRTLYDIAAELWARAG